MKMKSFAEQITALNSTEQILGKELKCSPWETWWPGKESGHLCCFLIVQVLTWMKSWEDWPPTPKEDLEGRCQASNEFGKATERVKEFAGFTDIFSTLFLLHRTMEDKCLKLIISFWRSFNILSCKGALYWTLFSLHSSTAVTPVTL